MKMIKQCIMSFLVIACTCNVQAQGFHMSDLEGKTWKGISGYIGIEYIDQYVQFTKVQSKYKLILKEDRNTIVNLTYDMYLSDSIPDKFDKNQIGRNNVGRYLVEQRIWDYNGQPRVDYSCLEILAVEPDKLVVKGGEIITTFVALK